MCTYLVMLAVCEASLGQPHSFLCAQTRRSQALLCFSTLDVSDNDDDDGDEITSAVATCVQTMPQLRTLAIHYINPLPVLQSLSHRRFPLDSITVEESPWVCTVYTYSDATSVLNLAHTLGSHSTVITVQCLHAITLKASLQSWSFVDS